jgi:stage II sporulation protein AA (anti-sigma F factor antagonist)
MDRHTSIEIELKDDICIVRVTGRLATGADDDYMRAKAQAIKNPGCRKIIADICELDSIGSTGIGFFVDLYTSVTKDTVGRFVLVGASQRVLKVLAVTGLNKIIAMAPDLAAGLAFCAEEDKVSRAGGWLA